MRALIGFPRQIKLKALLLLIIIAIGAKIIFQLIFEFQMYMRQIENDSGSNFC